MKTQLWLFEADEVLPLWTVTPPNGGVDTGCILDARVQDAVQMLAGALRRGRVAPLPWYVKADCDAGGTTWTKKSLQ